MRRTTTIWLATLFVAGTAAAADPTPGLYEVRMQMSLTGMPMQMPAMTMRHCLTAEDLKNGKAYAPENSQCSISDFRQTGARVSYRFKCAAEGRNMVGEASGSSTANGYEMTMNGKFQPAMEGVSAFSQTLKARRVGACGK